MRAFQLLSSLLCLSLIDLARAEPSLQKVVKRANLWETLPATPSLPSGYSENHLKITNGSLWYGVWEGPTSQPPLVFLPGAASSSDWFGNQIQHLKGSRKIITIDARQQGRSTGSGTLTYDIMAGDVLSVLDGLKIQKADFVGWSDGGVTLLNLNLNHASRLSRSFVYGANYNVAGNLDTSNSPVATQAASRLKSIYEKVNPSPNWANLISNISKMWASLPTWAQSDFNKIPTANGKKMWIVNGAHDEVVDPKQSADLGNWISGSTRLVLQDVSHYGFVQNPSEVNDALDKWLKIAT